MSVPTQILVQDANPVLTTERLTLRKLDVRDFPVARSFFATSRAEFVGGKRDAGEAWRTLAMMIGHWSMRGFGLFAFSPHGSDQALGIAGPWFPADWPEHEIGWHVWDPAHEGKGYAFEAARAARNYAREMLGMDQLVSYIAEGNTRSIALAERLGAVLDKKAPHPKGRPCLVYRHPREVIS